MQPSSFESPTPSPRRPSQRKASLGPFLITGSFLLLAWSTFVFLQHRSIESESALVELTPQQVQLHRPKKTVVPPLEPSPRPPVNAPDIPEPHSSKGELWSYGERYLGWQSAADVDLDEFDEAELRSWLEQDQKLWGDRAASAQDELVLNAAGTEQ